jgi:hypothetical protein
MVDHDRLFKQLLSTFFLEFLEALMEFTTSWHEEGRAEGRIEGRHQGAVDMVLRLVRRRIGDAPDGLIARIDALPIEALQRLGEDVLDLTTPADVETWLSRHE